MPTAQDNPEWGSRCPAPDGVREGRGCRQEDQTAGRGHGFKLDTAPLKLTSLCSFASINKDGNFDCLGDLR